MGETSNRGAEERVWRGFPPQARRDLEYGLSRTDLTTLLMSVARARARQVRPAELLRRWTEDRFVRPSAVDPRRLSVVEARLWELLPDRFVGVELSPVAPLGTVSALGHAPVDQHRVVSTIRGTEVVSDSANALAIEAGARRRAQRRGDLDDARVDVAACHRQLRAQVFGPGAAAHFRLFALVSSARDRGSGRTEADLVIDHLDYWRRALAAVAPAARISLTVTAFGDGVLRERLHDTVLPTLAHAPDAVPVVEDPARTKGAGYYAGLAIGVQAERDGEEVDLGDGGLTSYTAELLADAKERCLVSCVSTERLTALC